MTTVEFYEFYTDYDVLIDGMREKLLEAMKRSPKADFSDAHLKIEKLERLKLLFHTMYHEQLSTDNDSGKIMADRTKLLNRIQYVEKENAELKLQIAKGIELK